MRYKITCIIMTAVTLSSVYYGLIIGNEGATNIAYFLAWLQIVLSWFTFSKEISKKMSDKGRAFPAYVVVTIDGIVIAAFVWSGAIVTGGFLVLATILEISAFNHKED